MSKILTLFEKVTDVKNIEKAYKQALKGKNKYHPEAMTFSLDETYNLVQLQQSLINGTYRFGGYIRFTVYEPKERIVDAPHFVDKVVQLAINNVLKDIYPQSYIYDSYACLDNKGTHKAVDRVQHFLRKASWEYGESAYIIKLDVSKFFYSIDREILKKILRKKIKCEQTYLLLCHIIDSASSIDALGIPLGNTLSQVFANVHMNKLDQYCKRVLGLHYYVRYMDDAIVVVRNKEEAQRVMKLMSNFLEQQLNLIVNPKKTTVFPIEQGVNAFGFKIYKTHRLLRNDSKKKIKRKAKKMKHLIAEGRMSVQTAEQVLNSWLGHAKHASSYNFIMCLVDNNRHIYMNNKGVLKINLKEAMKDDCLQQKNMAIMSVPS